MSSHSKYFDLIPIFNLLLYLQAFSSAIVTKFSSIDMKSSGMKTVHELKGEIKLITASERTWAIWVRVFHAHNNGDLINLETEKKYNEDLKIKVPPILREFFRPLQGLLDSELYKAAQHLLKETPRRTVPYPKIFLKRPRFMKPSTYHMKEWCEYRKKKTLALREIGKLVPTYNLIDADGEIAWENWRGLKIAYHINGVSMKALVRAASPFLAQRSRKNEKKGSIDERETTLYKHFLDRKQNAKFGGVARFCVVANDFKFGKWDTHASRANVRDDPRGCPFAIFDFRAFPNSWKQPPPGTPFYDSFLKAFKSFRSPALVEPHVWLWIVDQERSTSVVDLYNSTMDVEYDIFHSTYVPAKTEGLAVIEEARGVKQVGAITLYFLTRKSSPCGRLPVKAKNVFKKIYQLPPPHPKELMDEAMFATHPAYELRMDFYIGVLKAVTVMSETVYNVFGGSKFVYAALVSTLRPMQPSYDATLRPRGRKL